MKYTLQFKTGDAELRALKNIPPEVYSNPDFALLIELTRGRRSKKDQIGDLNKRIDALMEFIPSDTIVYFDVTSDTNLSNSQIDNVFDVSNGYENWQRFFAELHADFDNSVPMLLVNDIDSDYSNFKHQIVSLANDYHNIGYKICPSLDEATIRCELEIIANTLKSIGGVNLTVFYDQGYIVDGLVKIAEEKAVDILGWTSGVLKDICTTDYVLTSTSFPDSVTSLSGSDEGVIPCYELKLFESVSNAISIPISYSDYGSITPKRNDSEPFFGNGWVPRIDIPVCDVPHIYYFRQKRKGPKGDKEEYPDVYIDVARKCVSHTDFPKNLACWGCETVINTSNGMKPGATPAFWISVRMNIFVFQQLRRLGLLSVQNEI